MFYTEPPVKKMGFMRVVPSRTGSSRPLCSLPTFFDSTSFHTTQGCTLSDIRRCQVARGCRSGILPPPPAAHPARHKQINRIRIPFLIFITLSFRASVPHHHVFRCPEAIIVFLLEKKLQQKDDVRSARDSTELQAFPALSGCWYVAAAVAGAAVTYYAVDKGYKVQTPVTHETPKKQQDKE